MSNFNRRLNRVFKTLLPEWLEPSLDHHLDNGITSDSFADIATEMRGHYEQEFKPLIDAIKTYLNNLGYTQGDTTWRQESEQELLEDLERLTLYAEIAVQHYQWAIDKELDQVSGLLDFRQIMQRITDHLKKFQSAAERTIEQLTKLNYRVPTTIISNLKRICSEIIADFAKAHHYLSRDGLTGNELDIPAEQLLETPEYQWLPYLSPDKIAQLAAQNPAHGPREAAAKVTHIINYGPDYNSAADMLQLLCQHWKIDSADILASTYDPDETANVTEWLRENGEAFGIDVGSLPAV